MFHFMFLMRVGSPRRRLVCKWLGLRLYGHKAFAPKIASRIENPRIGATTDKHVRMWKPAHVHVEALQERSRKLPQANQMWFRK